VPNRRPRLTCPLIVVALALLGAGPWGPAGLPWPSPAAIVQAAPLPEVADADPLATDPFLLRLVELTNAERRQVGTAPLAVSVPLSLAAGRYAEAMASLACFGHDCAPVTRLNLRIEGAGYGPYSFLGENVAAGQETPERVMAAWMASPGHRANILNAEFVDLGVGRASGGPYRIYWAQEFGTPRGARLAAMAPGESESAAAVESQ
jgi:uncharacterized protein YkwD